MNGLMQCSKQNIYSIASSARASAAMARTVRLLKFAAPFCSASRKRKAPKDGKRRPEGAA